MGRWEQISGGLLLRLRGLKIPHLVPPVGKNIDRWAFGGAPPGATTHVGKLYSDSAVDLDSAKGNSAKMMRKCSFFAVFLDNYTLTDDLHRYELDYIKNQENVIYVIPEQLQTWA